MNYLIRTKSQLHVGPFGKKILLLLGSGLTLSLTSRPDIYFKIIKETAKEWKKINQRNLKEAIKRLYQSKLLDYKNNKDGTVKLILNDNGKKRVLEYNLDQLKIKKPLKWDNLWRLVIFDIPESKKRGRNALALKLKELGFYPLQKSVFIYPYECRDEINFIVEIFDLAPYVRFLRVKNIDIELDLKRYFGLI
ncbi:MAG: CRISPR-associated endonuclease Cas2 [Parcubacteria group bacterium]|nr:CRISPR-associated endonuclease Cas2 [Parcubacteria group bacterium]